MKKLLTVFGVLFALFLVAIVVIPMVVDVDKYRPQIVKAANERLNGKLELGQLKLSLWGSIRVQVGGLDLSDAKGNKVVAVKDAYVVVPWTSIFGGAPLLTFNMQNPEVRVVKDVNGKMNVTTLMKTQPTAADPNAPAGGTAPGAAEGDGSAKIPAIVSNARLGVDIKNALLYYKDELAKSETVTKNLNLRVKDLSLSRKTEIELSGLFESQADKAFKITGPFKVSVDANPRVEGGEFKGLAATVDGNFDDLEIQAAQAFYKKKGVTAQLKGALDVTKEIATISKMEVKFFNAVIEASGKVNDLQGEPSVNLTMKSNTISLEPWNELIPMLKEYSLSGTASFDALANGPAERLQYGANLLVKDLKAKSPMLKSEPVVNIAMKVVTDKVEKFTATMRAPGNDLSIDGTVVSFTQPKIDLKVVSNSLDLDQLVKLDPVEKGGSKAAPANGGGAPGTGSGGAAGKPGAEDLDAMLDPLRENDIARATTMVANVNAKMIQYYGVKMTDFAAKLSLRNLVASVDSATVKLWDGTVGLKASSVMTKRTPTYSFSSTVSSLDMKKAVTSQFEMFKNTLLGKVNFKIDGSGASFNPEAAKKNLNAKGTMKVTDATFQTIDIAKMAGEAVNKALEKVGDKIPGAKGKSVKIPERNSRYEYVASDFTIANGRFVAPNFVAKAMKDEGFDVRGATQLGLIDQELKADWEIIDTYNMTKARDVGFEVSGVNVPSALSEGGNPVVIPISVGCKITAPCPSYGRVPEHFMKVALNNTKKGAVQAVKSEAKDKAKEAGKKLLKGLFN
jgi:uncharacterized protein involved in outer membrane biogenesis